MITFLSVASKKEENDLMKEAVREQAALRTDEMWKFHMFEQIPGRSAAAGYYKLGCDDEGFRTISGENPQGLPSVLSDGSCGRQYFTNGISAPGNHAVVTSVETGQQRESGHGRQ